MKESDQGSHEIPKTCWNCGLSEWGHAKISGSTSFKKSKLVEINFVRLKSPTDKTFRQNFSKSSVSRRLPPHQIEFNQHWFLKTRWPRYFSVSALAIIWYSWLLLLWMLSSIKVVYINLALVKFERTLVNVGAVYCTSLQIIGGYPWRVSGSKNVACKLLVSNLPSYFHN